MIYGNIENPGDMSIYPEAIQRAVKYLKETDLVNKKAGVYELQGKDMYVQVLDLETASREDKKPEVHRKYIDVQCLISGRERIGFAVDTGKNKPIGDYNEERDILFYEECHGESEMIMTPGTFAVFFPHIVHRPACNDGGVSKIRKIVIKINKDIL
ncbi:YhcH/YjgK/YiaL family protein [uncultured Ilyobacter sp.]|uniref:YhcH/YjgK/YiaL family protein n=1 Tax=uncultured Ilyobacter sp. TaxID=544433 RepID=UPI0029F48A3C|nr:YhcH/YjgK/YiaL family protein [uncultured Ilyobacter sp.]